MACNVRDLARPFPEDEVNWRIGNAVVEGESIKYATALAYLDARTIMDRLDEVCGPENWQLEFKEWPGGQLCGISILVQDESGARWITKWDGSEKSEIEPVKGGLSDAMKRAAVQWGIGRYLYRLKGMFAKVSDRGKLRGEAKGSGGKKVFFRWDPPSIGGGKSPIKEKPASPKPQTTTNLMTESGDWQDAVVHFGNLAGKKLGDLTEKQLAWFQNDWLQEKTRRGALPEDEPLFNALMASMSRTPPPNVDHKEEIPF